MDVLITRGGGFAERVQQTLLEAGLHSSVVPLVSSRPLADDRVLQAWRALGSGHFDWLAVTSATAVALLPERIEARIAAVGPATAAALARRGLPVDLLPDRPSAQDLVAAWPPPAKGGRRPTVLWPTSVQAHPTLAEGLTQTGLLVTRLNCYAAEPSFADAEAFVAQWPTRWQAVVVTSGTAAEQVARLGLAGPVVVSGAQTATDARALGLDVAAVADSPDAPSVAQAVLSLTTSGASRTDDQS